MKQKIGAFLFAITVLKKEKKSVSSKKLKKWIHSLQYAK